MRAQYILKASPPARQTPGAGARQKRNLTQVPFLHSATISPAPKPFLLPTIHKFSKTGNNKRNAENDGDFYEEMVKE
jgi:hypothetical protein